VNPFRHGIDKQIDTILRYPRNWGPPVAVEMLILLLLELRSSLVFQSESDRELLKERYLKFLQEELPESPPNKLLSDRDVDSFRQESILAKFVQRERGSSSWGLDRLWCRIFHGRIFSSSRYYCPDCVLQQ
jgi:hypothetical protein